MIEATTTNFETNVIKASQNQPVLVDIWAPWCAPCRSLAPILEKLEKEYQGNFILAKLNSDEHPQIAAQLSQMLGVRSIPVCVMFKDMQVVDAFVGAQTELQIRNFLERWVTPTANPEAENAEPQSEDPEALSQQWQNKLDKDPKDNESRFNLARHHLIHGNHKEAQALIDEIVKQEDTERRFKSLQMWLDNLKQAQTLPKLADLQAKVASNKRDFETRFQIAQWHMAAMDWDSAMDALLEIIMRDKVWRDEIARLTFIAILDIISDQTELRDNYRRQLSMMLF